MLASRMPRQTTGIFNRLIAAGHKTVHSTMRGCRGKLQAEHAALLVCDVQERFRSNIHKMDSVIDGSIRLCKGAAALRMPVIVTEQYPKALGQTVDELAWVVPEKSLMAEKTKFSMAVPEVLEHLKNHSNVKQLLITGLEGYEVHIIVDAVSSQRPGDRSIALKRMAQAGALLSTQEMALFQLAGDAKHPAFKKISALVKETRPESLL